MDVPFDQPGADSPHNSFSGAEIFVGGGADGGGGGGPNDEDDGRFHTSGITMYDEVGDGEVQRRADDRYEEQYVDDRGGYGHGQNPAAYRHQYHDGAAGYGGEDDFGGGGGGVDPRGGGGVGPAYDDQYNEEDYDEEYGDIGFDGRDLRSEPSRSSSSRSLLSKQSRSSGGSRSMASSSRQSYDSRRDPRVQSQYQNQSHYHQSHYDEDQPRYADDGRMGDLPRRRNTTTTTSPSLAVAIRCTAEVVPVLASLSRSSRTIPATIPTGRVAMICPASAWPGTSWIT